LCTTSTRASVSSRIPDVIDRERGRAAVRVRRHVGGDRHDEVRADDPAPGDRGAAGVHHHLHAVGLRPSSHPRGDLRILHARDADLADEPHAGRGHLGEVRLGQAVLEQDGARVDLHAGGAQVLERAVRQDRERLHAGRVGGAPRQMGLAGRQHRGHAAVQVRVDPVELLLARREVAEDRVRVVVAQARGHGGSRGVDGRRDPGDVGAALAADRVDHAVAYDDRVTRRDGRLDVAGDDRADVRDDEVAH
jgi:hypothetical protein